MPKVTFVLPGRGRSGGVRVTVEMANRLLRLGYDVRVAYRTSPMLTRDWFKDILKNFVDYKIQKLTNTDWLDKFNGRSKKYSNLSGVRFAEREVVIAVGTHTVRDVYRLTGGVIKVRYNHGLSLDNPELTEHVWGLPMTTVTVSNTLVSRLEELCGAGVAAVIPNGIDSSEYFVENGAARDGVGFMYSSHPIKRPEDMICFAQDLGAEMPGIPQYYFGTDPRPTGLEQGTYVRYPSVAEARKIYNRCLVWISTSLGEGLPGPILEAMACGCAVVSADNLGAKELIKDGKNGFLVPVGDIEAFVTTVRRLIADPGLRERIVGSAFNTVKKFSWEKAVEKMDTFLTGLVDGH